MHDKAPDNDSSQIDVSKGPQLVQHETVEDSILVPAT